MNTEKMLKAIEKIDGEAEKTANLKPFAQYIINNLIYSDECAEKILNANKSLNSCFDSIAEKARKSAVNNCAMIDDATVFSWVREYYGIKEKDGNSTQAEKINASNIVSFDIFADL